jgi:hypothetical protein
MKTMAELDGFCVVNIIVAADNEQETETLVTYTNENPAYIGGDYVNGFFYAPQPFPSWTRQNGKWQPPTPHPTDGEMYSWDEASGQWLASD